MKRIAVCLLMFAASASGAGSRAYAADGAGQERQLSADSTEARGSHAETGAGSIARVSDYIGKGVVNVRDQELGEIIDLAIDGARGRVVYAVLAAGGWLGMGRELYAVPIGALHPAAGGDGLKLATSQARFREQDAFDADRWPMEANSALVETTPAGSSSRSGRLETPPTDPGNQTGR